MRKQKRCAIYVRVSSEDSKDSGLSIEVQERSCRKAADEQGFVVAEVFKDEAISAYLNKHRPGYDEMLNRLQEFDAILVYKLCRFGRREREIHNAVGDIVEAGVGFYSVTEGFDLLTPMGRAMMGVTATFAELWSAMTQERVRAAVHQAASEGRKHGFPPYGYMRPQPKATIVPDPKTAPVARRIFQEYADGVPLAQICRGLNRDSILTVRGRAVWTTAMIRKMLARPTYIGKIVHGRTGQIFDGLHEAIIDRDVWDACQKRLAGNRGVPPKARGGSLSPLLRCGYCGASMSLSCSHSRFRSYHCRPRMLAARRHEPLFIKTEIMEAYIWLVVEEMHLPEAEVAFRSAYSGAEAKPNKAVQKLKQERSELEEQIKYNLNAAREAGLPLNLLAEINGPPQQRLQEVEEEIRRLQEQTVLPLRQNLRDDLAETRAGGHERQRQFLRQIFSHIEVFRDRFVFHGIVGGEPLIVMRQIVGRHGVMPESEKLQIL